MCMARYLWLMPDFNVIHLDLVAQVLRLIYSWLVPLWQLGLDMRGPVLNTITE